MENIATQLKNDKESMLIQVKEVNQMIDAAIKTIKVFDCFFFCSKGGLD